MFKKKKCQFCDGKISGKENFCPNCGRNITSGKKKDEESDYGLLGKNDFLNENNDPFSSSLLGGFAGNMLGKMLNNAMNMLEKEMREANKQNINSNKTNKDPMFFQGPKTNFELRINGKKIPADKIKILQAPMQGNPQNQNSQKKANQIPEKPEIYFDEKTKKKFLKLPQETPETNVRRLSDKIVYEIKLPGVKTIKNISVRKLENTTEIKAVSDKKSYFKIIQAGMPITDYYLEKGKLVLELEAKD